MSFRSRISKWTVNVVTSGSDQLGATQNMSTKIHPKRRIFEDILKSSSNNVPYNALSTRILHPCQIAFFTLIRFILAGHQLENIVGLFLKKFFNIEFLTLNSKIERALLTFFCRPSMVLWPNSSTAW